MSRPFDCAAACIATQAGDENPTQSQSPTVGRPRLRLVTSELLQDRKPPQASGQRADDFWYRAGHRFGHLAGRHLNRIASPARVAGPSDPPGRSSELRATPVVPEPVPFPMRAISSNTPDKGVLPRRNAPVGRSHAATILDFVKETSKVSVVRRRLDLTLGIHRANVLIAGASAAGLLLSGSRRSPLPAPANLLRLAGETMVPLLGMLASPWMPAAGVCQRAIVAVTSAVDVYELTQTVVDPRYSHLPAAVAALERASAAIPTICSLLTAVVPPPWSLPLLGVSVLLPLAMYWILERGLLISRPAV